MELMILTSSPIGTVLMNDLGEIISIYNSLEPELLDQVRDKLVVCDNIGIEKALSKEGIKTKIELHNKILSNWRKNRFDLHTSQTGLVTTFEGYYEIIRSSSLHAVREEVKKHSAKSDEIVAQIIHAIDDLQKSVNLSSNRLTELYSLHFPEMVNLITNTITLARIINEEPQRKKLTKEILTQNNIPKAKIDFIMGYINDSLGGDLTETELIPLQEYSQSLITMYEKMKNLEDRVEESMGSIAPNLTAVSGANVGARLISAMGSLKALALKSSSKIQIIGAEKALYSALRSRGNPPKHGIIFQIPEIGNSPYWVRGKIARAFASKIAIAARIDFFEGEFIGTKMREDLRAYEADLRVKFPNPPPEKPKVERKREYKSFKKGDRKGGRRPKKKYNKKRRND